MSRTINQIYDAINASKATMPELQAFVVNSGNPGSIQDTADQLANYISSSSKVANWRLWIWIMAVASWVIENLFDAHIQEINTILTSKTPHHLRWYAEESKKFQYGYGLTWKDNQFQYLIDDPASQIIKYAAASESNGKVILKVATINNGVKVALSQPQKDAFDDFWSKWKDAGVNVETVSQGPDELKIDITIIRDRLILDADNNLLRDPNINPINDAIAAFGSSLEFDGILRLSHLVDAIQAAEGVVDVSLITAEHKAEGGVFAPVIISVESVAGYFIISQNSTFNFINNVQAIGI